MFVSYPTRTDSFVSVLLPSIALPICAGRGARVVRARVRKLNAGTRITTHTGVWWILGRRKRLKERDRDREEIDGNVGRASSLFLCGGSDEHEIGP